MNPKVFKYLEDVLVAIEEIQCTVNKRGALYAVFLEDYVFRKFIERNIEIIGEAVNRILKIDAQISITHARKIVDCRNYVIHAYDSLNNEVLWAIVINHLPLLKEEVMAILDRAEK